MVISAVVFGAMMLLVSADAFARYFISTSIGFQFEFTQNYLMVAGCMLGLSWSKSKGAFIHISAAGRFLSDRGRLILHSFNHFCAAGVFYYMTYLSSIDAYSAYMEADVIFGYIDWPVWASEVWVPVGLTVLATRFLYDGMALLLGRDVPGLVTSSELEEG
ncbi:TRAP transporter small permease [Halomonas sp. Y3]|uniref:TRAP transporter small permease n=1 Tax=Halomonas sp. Y3 TaxID=2956797 RepID=UPI0020A18AE9|nr:TRAP transporter small permease [Halomonas sp. Y3]